MGIEVAARKPQVVVVPFPGQGHINPALAFANCLATKGLAVTVVVATSVAKSASFSDCASLTIRTVSDGSEHVDGIETMEAFFNRFRCDFARNLADFIDEHMSCARAIIYDSIMPWMLDIAKERGLLGASFFTQTCGVSAVFHHLGRGLLLRYPYEDGVTVALPALPPLEKRDLPSFFHLVDPDQLCVKLLTDQFSNIERADWIFFNTFDKLETEIIEWMKRRWPAMATVGPTFLLDHQHKNHSISLFEAKQDACREWLDSMETASVVYVSFGSIASLDKEQMEELAQALIMSGFHFLWVVRSSELDKLPPDFTSTTEKGLIVEWCHQPEVLAHRAVACFVTHCGWNSTLEAVANGVPLVAMAQWVDQKTNAKFVVDVWGVGAGVESGGREEIALCIKRVASGDEFRRNASKWKELASEAVGSGGTSVNNINDFVSKLVFADAGDISPTSVLA
ncbi:UDP glycosyltransferase 9-like [Salvia miltiorrhiza]|uniref:UDP glycosyltransferase 9-like n=1 Tax=Salvia miltiorrhiza TaxID=226208 RepID=UPI0025AC53B6|nr:UDP glycosyltransferase 9-like [Salvia miltiorrhiza]